MADSKRDKIGDRNGLQLFSPESVGIERELEAL